MSTPTVHVGVDDFFEYFTAALDEDRALVVEEHVATCADCTAVARRIHALTMVGARSTVETLKRAYAALEPAVAPPEGEGNTPSGWQSLGGALGEMIPELVFTALGWKALGRLDVGARVGQWRLGSVDAPASLTSAIPPMALSHVVEGVGTLTLLVQPSGERDWRLSLRLTQSTPGALLVVGLQGATQKRLGTRTVSEEREQLFIVSRAELSELRVDLEWRTADGGRLTRTLPLPVRSEI